MIYQTTNTRCLIEACNRLGLVYKIFDENSNLIEVETKNGKLFFANYSTPFNSDSFCRITKDKQFTSLILKDAARMPKTAGIFDPNYDEGGEISALAPKSICDSQALTDTDGLRGIVEKITEQFDFPIVIKPKSLSRGRNFSICKNEEEILIALKKVFKKNQNYDYVALAQEYVKPKVEYRVVVFRNEVTLVYTVKKEIKDEAVINELKEFIKPIFGVLEIGFAGLDIIVAEDGRKFLLEINAEPGFANFVSKEGDEPIIEMYCSVLKS